MSKATLYNYSPNTPADITDEYYHGVGSDAFILGDVKRGFLDTDFIIEYGDSDGVVLTVDVDYELQEQDFFYQEEAGLNVFTKVQILNPAYYTGGLFITYKCVGSYTDADTITSLISDLTQAKSDIVALESVSGSIESYLTDQAGGFWGDIVYKDADEITILPKGKNGVTPFIGARLNDKTFLSLTSAYTVKLAVPASSGHILDGITAALNNEWYRIVAYEDSGSALAFGIFWMPYTTFSNANPTNSLTLNQVNSQNIGYLFPEDAELVLWQDTDEWETPYAWQNAGAVTYDPSKGKPVVSSRNATTLTLGANLENTDFTASSVVYQVGNFKPVQVSDGAIATAIGARGYMDTGFRFRTNGSAQILNFDISENSWVLYANGTGAADYTHLTGVEQFTLTNSFVNFRVTYAPPDRPPVMWAYRDGTTSSDIIMKSMYKDSYGTTSVSVSYNNGITIHPEITNAKHGILCAKYVLGVPNNFTVRGYLL